MAHEWIYLVLVTIMQNEYYNLQQGQIKTKTITIEFVINVLKLKLNLHVFK